GVAAGELMRDERLRDYMAGVGDPLAGDPSPAGPSPSPDALEAEQRELELDAMHVLARTERMLMIRHDEARAQVRELQGKVERLRSKSKRPERRRPLSR